VRAQRNAFTDLALTLLLGFALACGVLILLILARYAKLFVHDFHHLFPQGVSTWQSAIVAAVLVVLPALLGMGLLGSVALAAVAVALLLARAEAIALVTAFVLLAGAQYVVGDVLQSGAFGRTAQDVYLLERGDAPEAAALRLQGRSDHGLGNYATAFALGHYHKRFGRLAEAKTAYDAARKIRETPELTNNIGNVLFLQGDTDAARKNYNESIQKNSSLPAPYWNLAKIYFREGKLEIGTKTTEQARSVDPEGATASAGEGQGSGEPDANSYMKDVPLSDSEISKLADDEASAVVTGGGATWSSLTGRAGASLAIVIALLAALLVGAAQFLQPKLDPSSYCERCGRPVCVRCDPELGQTKGMCGQCISVFVRRTGVDGPDRLRKEIEVRQFRRRSRLVVRALGALWGGGGHIFAGRVIGGSTFITLFALLFSQVIFWHGIFRSPMPVHLSSSAWHVGAYVGAFVVLYALSLVHLMRYEEAD
jgi:tetratricopeptide (TPR) repeat protein